MRELLAACVDLETLAIDLYGVFAETTKDDELRALFAAMRADEMHHVRWWRDVEDRIVAGQLTDIDTGTHVTAYMRAIVATLREMLASDTAAFSDEDRLALAASLEFYALDPVFAQLVAESDPREGNLRRDQYEKHVALLASAMEARRSWVLAPHIALLRNTADSTAEALGADIHDAETGLPLSAVAEQAIEDLCANPARDGGPISLALIQIAGLQSAYDLDPALGDRTLLRVVSVVTSLLRLTDLLVRPEGSRLAVVMPGTGSTAAVSTMRAIAQAVAHEGAGPVCGTEPLRSVASVVTMPPLPGACCDAAEAFSAAEKQLVELVAAGQALGAIELG
ncbi:MAG: diguanylate cyclase [Coriobacteriia bacterium]|nr:diguanylate cyclase [Coriobacteriia bacterium]